MRCRLGVLFILMLCMLPKFGYAIEKVRVVVLPFEIHAREDLVYLENQVKEVIKNHLIREGALVVDSDITVASWKKKAETLDGIRSFGAEKGADYVIWGSLTRIGQKFSLDAKLIESFGDRRPTAFFQQGENIENLPGILKSLTDQVAVHLFKRERVAEVLVVGNNRIEEEAIKRVIQTKPGDIYLAKSLSEDLKAVYAMGYFDDIRIEAEDRPDGKTIIFRVTEKPTIRRINLKGNKVIKDEELRETLTVSTGSILNVFRIQSNVQRIEAMYKQKNYHGVEVAYKVLPLENNQADLDFVITEGERLFIRKISFEGNRAYPGKTLKKYMKTSEKGFFSFITNSGNLNLEDLNQDAANIAGFYHNNGYIDAKVGDPQVDFTPKQIGVTIRIDEGPRFKTGAVDIQGDFILPREELIKELKITQETYYNRETLRNDVLALRDVYAEKGYAYADVVPQIEKDDKALLVNINYSIDKGKPVHFEKIIIGGNVKTRDKVIRRELAVYEDDQYRGKALKRSIRNLHRLDFFEDVNVNTYKGSADDKMILKIDVTEKPTGAFRFGGGYSTVENVFVTGSLSQKNLFGRGQTLDLSAQLGATTTMYLLNFTEPWLFDIPLSAGVDLYNWEKIYDTYDKNSVGGGVRFSYPVFDFTRLYVSYGYEDADISNIAPYAAKSIQELEGKNVTSSVTTALRYDSRNRIFNASEGSDHRVSVQYAGLGGDIGFTKLTAETAWYISLHKYLVNVLHAEAGWVIENKGRLLPDYERFYLGGINSLRGFDFQEVSAYDEDGAQIGGEKYVQFNIELVFPLVKEQGVYGLVFFDTGQVYGPDEKIDLGVMRETAGFGVRWYSPIGPIRLENGYILDPKPGETTSGRWEFSIGGTF